MNINEQLTCKYCNEIYNEPVTLSCCGDNICRRHINELLSTDHTNKFCCPFCNTENTNQNLYVNKLIQRLVENELHKLKLDSSYKLTLNRLKEEIEKMETILRDPENLIYEEINELKRQLDLDREKLKIQIDLLADEMFQQLESYERKIKAEHKANIDSKHYNNLVESSREQLIEFERCLNLFSAENEERNLRQTECVKRISFLETKIQELKDKTFSNLSITYTQANVKKEDLFGKLIIKKRKFLGESKKEFKGHNGWIYALAVLPNGDLVSGSADTTIKIWDTNDGKVKQILNGHTDCLWDLIVFDKNCLISAFENNKIKMWNLDEGKVERIFTGHTQRVLALKEVKHGLLASGSSDKTIKIWNINDGALKKTLIGHTGSVWSLVLLNNGDLVSGSKDETIKIWNIDSGTVKMTLKGHSSFVNRLALLANGDLVSGSRDNTIKIWNIADGTVKRTLIGHTSFVLSLKTLDNGDLVSGSADGTIKIWDVGNGTVKKDIRVNSAVHSFEVLQNGDLVSGSGQSIIIWD